ncbi:hypothetical protein AV530_002469 [Patagioenas fasciata monilis]|uniref:Uncharacterized protein n=1 Tax=Patagioenas fasciata monilis TaxID=372326 RepID=A0A1V4K6I5_PATFA|nr:hypothetical protein AV530_002469 [Patagioenas fasciata monilis]
MCCLRRRFPEAQQSQFASLTAQATARRLKQKHMNLPTFPPSVVKQESTPARLEIPEAKDCSASCVATRTAYNVKQKASSSDFIIQVQNGL